MKKHFFSFAVVFLAVGILFHLFSGQPAQFCANSISCEKSEQLQVDNSAVGIFDNQKIIPPQIDLTKDVHPDVLGAETTASYKHIYVDLTNQMLYAYQDGVLFMKTKISSGKTLPTPTGEFTIWVKVRATRMEGGSGSEYYNLPNVPYVMFFSNNDVAKSEGFSFHGAYWHNNFGHPMSHGCINMRLSDSEKLYNWASPETTGPTTYADAKNAGTKVTIYGVPPT